MRRVANSVAVVSTSGPGGRRGATVTAFCSVSADPPTVLVCLNADSRIAQAVSANGSFCVNVLDHRAAELAERFAGRSDALEPDRFARVRTLDEAGWPVLHDSVVAFCCRLQELSQRATHFIAIGEVARSYTFEREEPLAYWSGGFGTILPHPMRPAR